MYKIKVFAISFLLLLISHQYVVNSQSFKYGFEIAKNKNKVVIPFELRSNLIVVDVVFQNVIPLKFIVDTGVTNCVLIDKLYTDLLNIEPNRKMTLVGAAGGREVEAYIANQVQLSVANERVRGHNIPILILAEDYLKLHKQLGINVHGILGYEFFKNFVVKIDYKNQYLTLYKESKFNKWLWFYRELNMGIEGNKPYINAQITGQDSSSIESKLMIDTGASHALMLHANSSDKISIPIPNVRDTIGAGIAGNIEGHIGRISELSISDLTLKNVVSTYPDIGAYNDIIENTGRNGTVGGEMLSRYKVILDYTNEKLFLKKTLQSGKDFEYDMSGISFVAKGEFLPEPIYYIQRVRKNTAAHKAGLKKGDIITNVNGNFGEDLSYNYIFNLFRSKAGKKIRITVKRNEELRKFQFRLQPYI